MKHKFPLNNLNAYVFNFQNFETKFVKFFQLINPIENFFQMRKKKFTSKTLTIMSWCSLDHVRTDACYLKLQKSLLKMCSIWNRFINDTKNLEQPQPPWHVSDDTLVRRYSKYYMMNKSPAKKGCIQLANIHSSLQCLFYCI